MTADVSRSFQDRDKAYDAVVRQQGRIPTDAEENHASELAGWAHDAEFVETITPLGTPDDGFRITVPAGITDAFQVGSGAYYLGGQRIVNPQPLIYADQVESNWLTQDDPVTAGGRILVWLEAEERTVTAVQDTELLEPALRGADGSGRTRVCWRVRQAPTGQDSCSAALDEVLAPDVAAARDRDTGQIRSHGTLTVGFDDSDIDLDLCKPAIEPGYLGNRNNTFRVKLTRPGHFVWGEDNAAQLYRVTVDADRRTIRFLTEPRDEYLRPRPGQSVELLRGDVLLPNWERIAEPDGDLFQVTGGYQVSSTPGARPSITVGSDVDPAWLSWLATSPQDPAAPPGTVRHLYLRVWTGGGEASAPDVAFTPGTPRTLTGTGLTLTFDGATLPGDGWTLSARPDAPTRVLPWALRDGMTAHGPRRHVAALAIVDLTTGEVHDCRQRFRPLHKIPTCCTVTVGPPGTTRGDVDSVSAALDLLPPEGGTVCLLAGEHPANVLVDTRRDVRFTGCPGRTIWVPENPDEPLVGVVDSFGIGFSDIEFHSGSAPALVSGRWDPSDPSVAHGGLSVTDCVFVAPAGCAVLARSLAGATLLRCRVQAGPYPEAVRSDGLTGLPAVFLQGDDLVVQRCEIRAGRDDRMVPARLALGGLQIGGGSRRVCVRDCHIVDGSGIGVTLGSIVFVTVRRDEFERNPALVMVEAVAGQAVGHAVSYKLGWQAMLIGFLVVTGEAGCIGVDPVDPGPEGDDEVQIPVSEGMLEDVDILGNHIHGMGASGIATYPLGLAPGGPAGDAVAVRRLVVADNRITDCLRFPVSVTDPLMRAFLPVGGIALAVALDCLFRGNEILRNGSHFGGGTCGIGIVYGEDVRITDNRIEDNGRHDPQRFVTGPNSGIHLSAVRAGIADKVAGLMAAGDGAALTVHGNTVSQPAGRALRALALGPVMVDDNRLVGGNRSRLFAELTRAAEHLTYTSGLRTTSSPFDLLRLDLVLDLLGGDAVNVVNLGISTDLVLVQRAAGSEGATLAADFAQFVAPSPAVARLPATKVSSLLRFGGPTMFHDNQVCLHRPLPDGPPLTLSSILLASLDDVGFADNQFSIEPDVRLAIVDALILGSSVRITGNRGQEAVAVLRSVLSLALLWNTAALNQTTRPILAAGLLGSVVQLNLSA